MKQLHITTRFLFISTAILLAGLTRLIDHPFNFTAIGAMALFGGASFTDRRVAILLPMLTMLVTDLILGFHDTMIYVYPSIVLISVLGIYISNRRSFGTILVGTLASSFLFFMITNFGVWAAGGLYPMNFSGLMQSYVSGLAFYDHSFFGNLALNTVMGDLFFSALLFGSLAFASLRFPQLAKV